MVVKRLWSLESLGNNFKPLKWSQTLLQLGFGRFTAVSENITINVICVCRAVWVFPEIHLQSSLSFCQLKGCVRVSKQGWWTWLCGWGPALTIQEVTHLQGGIQYPGLSLRNFLNKTCFMKGRGPVLVVTVCYLAFQNDQVWFSEASQHHWW